MRLFHKTSSQPEDTPNNPRRERWSSELSSPRDHGPSSSSTWPSPFGGMSRPAVSSRGHDLGDMDATVRSGVEDVSPLSSIHHRRPFLLFPPSYNGGNNNNENNHPTNMHGTYPKTHTPALTTAQHGSTPTRPLYSNRDNQHPGDITPYLGLRARLTQVPINRWTVLLLLVLARMLILFGGLNTALENAREEATAACASVEAVGSTLASMPYYMSFGVNKLVANGITDTVHGLYDLLVLILQAGLQIIMFLIELTYGTLACVADTYIHGLLTLATAAIQNLLADLSKSLQAIASGLGTAVKDLADAINSVESDVDKTISGMTFGLASPPSISWPSVGPLQSGVAVLDSFQGMNGSSAIAAITSFNNSVPNYAQVEADVQAVIGLPFTTLETLLNESLGSWTMDPSLLGSPGTKQALTFCSGNDMLSNFFNVLFTIERDAKIIAIAGIIVGAVLMAAIMWWWETKRFRAAARTATALFQQHHEPLDVVYRAARPMTTRAGLWMSEKMFPTSFSSSPPSSSSGMNRDKDNKNDNLRARRQMLLRWCLAYTTTHSALFVLSLALAGGLSALGQFLVWRTVSRQTAPMLAQDVGGFVSAVLASLEDSSAAWANGTNAATGGFAADVNGHVLVYVSDATQAITHVIDVFENQTEKVLGEALGKVPALENFANGMLGCILLDKLDRVKEGLAWVQENAQFSMPVVPADVFMLGVNSSAPSPGGSGSSLAGLLTSSGNSAGGDISAAVDKVTNALWTSMITEGLIALVLLLVYIAYVLLAVAQAALRMTCLDDRRMTRQNITQMTTLPQPRQIAGPNNPGGRWIFSDTPRSLASSKSSVEDVSGIQAMGAYRRQATAHGASQLQAHSQAQRGPQPHVSRPDLSATVEEDPFGDDAYAV